MDSIQYSFYILEKTRLQFTTKLKPLSNSALNYIPPNFNNNLIWNFGHLIATHQLLIYGLSNTEMYMQNDLISKYRKGSKPVDIISDKEIQKLHDLSEQCLESVQKDYKNGIFGAYKEYTTSYGTTLKSVEEAILFNNVHEAMHLGTCIDILKLL